MAPQWGSNSKGKKRILILSNIMFQSPQWGSNSKEVVKTGLKAKMVSVPAMGK